MHWTSLIKKSKERLENAYLVISFKVFFLNYVEKLS